jgi:molybdopterin-guanine dinucleotide biosynthesis protein A
VRLEEPRTEISCIVLAGGKSLRLGYDKVQEVIGEKSLLERVISKVSLLSNNIILVTAKDETALSFKECPKLRVVTDIYPDKGPLGGIYTGLAASTSFYNLVVAADMPFLNQALLSHMIELAANFDAVVPRLGKLVEPLHTIYSKNCLPPIKEMIEQGKLKISQLFHLVKVRYVEAEEIERFDPKYLSLFNINTEADLARARELAKEDWQ